MFIVLIGPPGAGKGTQCGLLVERFGIHHLSTGEILRQEVENDSEIGKVAGDYISRGKLVPDDIMVEIVAEQLSRPVFKSGCLLDGFPRTTRQAEALEAELNRRGQQLSVVIELHVPEEELLSRLSDRGRSDDAPEVVRGRLRSFQKRTDALGEFYESRGLFEKIDGLGTPDEVFQRIRAGIERRKAS